MTPKKLILRRIANVALTSVALQCLNEAERDPEQAVVLFAEKANADQAAEEAPQRAARTAGHLDESPSKKHLHRYYVTRALAEMSTNTTPR